MRREVGTRADAAGFTIIEVTLFLAISGALVVGLLATVGFAISRQRFTDSLSGTQAFIQSQYNETLNVVNDRPAGTCTAASGTTMTGSGTVGRGSSGCVVLGRAIVFNSSNPAQILAYPVVGEEPASSTGTGGQLLTAYKPGVDTTSPEEYEVPWGAQVFKVDQAGTSTPVSRILLLRSPDSGLVLTFADNGGASLAGALSSPSSRYDVCLRSGDLTSAIAAVSLSAVAGSEGVTTQGDINTSQPGSPC